jgi:hypothetical protein
MLLARALLFGIQTPNNTIAEQGKSPPFTMVTIQGTYITSIYNSYSPRTQSFTRTTQEVVL